MQLFPGIAPLTVATSGAGPGVIVTSGPTDTHGWWPGPFEAQGNDPRSAANLMAMGEALTDRTNWIGWRVADFIFGGDYIALFRGLVQFGNVWTLDRSWNNGTEAVVQIFGPTGGGDALAVFAGGANGNAIKAQAFGAGLSLNGIGTVQGVAKTGTDTPGGDFTGDGTAPGMRATAGSSADVPAIECVDGGIKFQSYAIAEADLLPANTFAQAHFARCHGVLRTDGAGGIGSTGQGINILSFGISGQFVLVTLATSMVNASFAVVGTFQTTSGTPNFTTTGAYPLVRDGVLGGTTAFFLGAWNGSSQINLATTAGDLEFAVFSRQ